MKETFVKVRVCDGRKIQVKERTEKMGNCVRVSEMMVTVKENAGIQVRVMAPLIRLVQKMMKGWEKDVERSVETILQSLTRETLPVCLVCRWEQRLHLLQTQASAQ